MTLGDWYTHWKAGYLLQDGPVLDQWQFYLDGMGQMESAVNEARNEALEEQREQSKRKR